MIDPSGNFIIEWPSKPGALYKIESSGTLAGGWLLVEDNVPAASVEAATTYDLGPATSPTKNFFRVILKE